jgi:hypothetical protein
MVMAAAEAERRSEFDKVLDNCRINTEKDAE